MTFSIKAISKQVLCLLIIGITFSSVVYAQKKANKNSNSFSPASNIPSKLTIAFYNVENLFDTEDDPLINDEEFLPSSKSQWTLERYQAKLIALGRVIDTLGGVGGPDILGLCEVENKKVIEDLIASNLMKAKNYQIIHKNSPDRRGIDVAMIYKADQFKPFRMRWKAINYPEDTSFRTRDILLVSGILPNKDTLHVAVNHFPSRSGGQEGSEPKRIFVAEQLKQLADSILARSPQAKILCMGDFNDEPMDKSLTQHLGGSGDQNFSEGNIFYNPMYALKQDKKGTHYYRGEFSMLDQFFLTKGLLTNTTGKNKKFVYAANSASIYNPIWMQQQDEKYKGAPNRTYVGPRYFGGFSDHFPVYLHLTLK